MKLPKKSGVGRPTDYRKSFCLRAISYGRQGLSRAIIAAKFDISRQALFDWEKKHPEFLDAMTRARDLAQAWWEEHRPGQSPRTLPRCDRVE